LPDIGCRNKGNRECKVKRDYARNTIAKYALSLESFYLNKIIIIMAIIKNYTTVECMTRCGGSKGEIKR